jgi:hypothetical protein
MPHITKQFSCVYRGREVYGGVNQRRYEEKLNSAGFGM